MNNFPWVFWYSQVRILADLYCLIKLAPMALRGNLGINLEWNERRLILL